MSFSAYRQVITSRYQGNLGISKGQFKKASGNMKAKTNKKQQQWLEKAWENPFYTWLMAQVIPNPMNQ